jgi:hypothetical protein
VVARSNPDGTGFNLSLLGMSAHSGTHMDAPCHFIADGKRVHEIDPARFVTPALVAEFAPDARIDAGHIAALPLRPGDPCSEGERNRRDARPTISYASPRRRQVVCCGVHVVHRPLSIEAYDIRLPRARILLATTADCEACVLRPCSGRYIPRSRAAAHLGWHGAPARP